MPSAGPHRSAMAWFLSMLRVKLSGFFPWKTRIWQAFIWKPEKRKPSGHASQTITHCISSGTQVHTGHAQPAPSKQGQLQATTQCHCSVSFPPGFRRAPLSHFHLRVSPSNGWCLSQLHGQSIAIPRQWPSDVTITWLQWATEAHYTHHLIYYFEWNEEHAR